MILVGCRKTTESGLVEMHSENLGYSGTPCSQHLYWLHWDVAQILSEETDLRHWILDKCEKATFRTHFERHRSTQKTLTGSSDEL